jgi:RecA/RadA recombinase
MPVSAKLQQLESLLRERGLGRALPAADKPIYEPLPTGRPEIDLRLGGGLPRGAISEVLGPQSSGRTALLFSALAQATQAGEVTAYIDATDCLDPRSAEQAGIVLERLLWVRCDPRESPRYGRAREQPVDQAWQALNLVAVAGGFGLIVADLGGLSRRKLAEWQRRPWVRLRQAVEHTSTALTVLTERHVAQSAFSFSLDQQSLDRKVKVACAA